MSHKYKLLQISEDQVPVSSDITTLFSHIDLSDEKLHDALVDLKWIACDCFQNEEVALFSLLISKKAFEKLMSIYCYAEDPGTRELAAQIMAQLCLGAVGMGVGDEDVHVGMEDILVNAAISQNEMIAKGATAAVMKEAVEAGGSGGSVSRTVSIAGAPSFLHAPLPDEPAEAASLLRAKERMVGMLAELAKAQVPFTGAAEVTRAVMQLNEECQTNTADDDDSDSPSPSSSLSSSSHHSHPLTDEWEALLTATKAYLKQARRAGYVPAEIPGEKEAHENTELRRLLTEERRKTKEDAKKLEESKKQIDSLQTRLRATESKLRETTANFQRLSTQSQRGGPVSSLNALSLSVTNAAGLKKEKNSLIHTPDTATYESALIGPEMTNGVYRIVFKPRTESPSLCISICNSAYGLPPSGHSFASSGRGLDWRPFFPCLMSPNNEVIGWTQKAKVGDELEIEVDIQSPNSEKRVARFVLNGSLQKTVVHGLPECLKFGISMQERASNLEFSLFQDVRLIGDRKVEGGIRKDWIRSVVPETVSAESSKPIRSETSLAALNLTFTDPAKFRTHANSIQHVGTPSVESFVFNEEFRTGVHRLQFLIGKATPGTRFLCGIINTSLGLPRSGSSFIHHGVQFDIANHSIHNSRGQFLGMEEPRVKQGDTVGMEVDLRGTDGLKRSIYWFINGIQQKVVIFNIPASIKMGVVIQNQADSFELVSLEDLREPTRQQKKDELRFPFEGEEI